MTISVFGAVSERLLAVQYEAGKRLLFRGKSGWIILNKLLRYATSLARWRRGSLIVTVFVGVTVFFFVGVVGVVRVVGVVGVVGVAVIAGGWLTGCWWGGLVIVGTGAGPLAVCLGEELLVVAVFAVVGIVTRKDLNARALSGPARLWRTCQ